MKAGLVGAAPCDIELNKHIDYIGVDGGVETLMKQGIKPKMIIGDFDSLEDKHYLEELNHIVLPMKKDDTDTAVAIEYLIKNGYNEIDLYGVTGGRIDHFMAVLCLMKRYHHYKLTVYDHQNKMYLLTPGIHTIYKQDYKYISFFAIDETFITINGCQYILNQYLLKQDDPLCVSNEIIKDTCIIENTNDLFVIQSNNKEV